MSDVECPYCGEDQEICHDDGYGYEENRTHEQECSDCEKTFVYTTSISFDYDAHKADCLNGGSHTWRATFTVPREYTLWRCEDCGTEEPLTDSEKMELQNTKPKDMKRSRA